MINCFANGDTLSSPTLYLFQLKLIVEYVFPLHENRVRFADKLINLRRADPVGSR
jgi:hypothetical protein